MKPWPFSLPSCNPTRFENRTLAATLAGSLMAVSLLAGCSKPPADSESAGGGSQSATSAGLKAKPRIALIMKSLANEFFSTMTEGARQHQAAHSDQYDLIVNGIKDERDLSRQVGLVEEMTAQKVDAIVIAPADSKALVPVLKRALDQGVVVINIDNKLDDAVLAQAGVRVPFVGPDNRAGARKVGDYLAGKLKSGDTVAVLEGIRTSFNGQQRRLGFEEAMKGAGLEIVSSQTAQWEMNIANQISSAILSEHPDLKAILACNDNMALGALAAVKSAGRTGRVLIVGFDNIKAVQAAIRQGKILATADQHGDQLAVFGIEHALEALSRPAQPAGQETPVDLVTAAELH
jgi:ribose transport system substrate-binding protein